MSVCQDVKSLSAAKLPARFFVYFPFTFMTFCKKRKRSPGPFLVSSHIYSASSVVNRIGDDLIRIKNSLVAQ